MASTRTAPRDAEATRQRLLRAALELYTTEGYRAATTERIASRAGVAEGTIYRHFRGKEELFNEAYRGALRWGHGLVEELAADRALGARELLDRLGRRLAEGAERDPPAFRMLLGVGVERHLDEPSRAARAAFRGALQQVMARGKSDGLVRAGPVELWAEVWLAVVGFVGERVSAREWAPEHPQVALALRAAWDSIALPERS